MATKTTAPEKPLINHEEDAGVGLTNLTMADLAKPFLVILQKMSPQCDDTNGEFIRGAKPGMLFNTVSKEIMDGVKDGIYFIPTGYVFMLVEWKDRDNGGGLVAMHKDISTVGPTKKDDKGRDRNAANNIIAPTAYHYGKYLDKKGNIQFAVISMASTQLKKSRNWNSLMVNIRLERGDGSKFTPASYSHQYHLTTVAESNDKGSWYGWKIENAGIMTDNALVLECRENAKLVAQGALLLTTTPADHVEPVAANHAANTTY